MPASAPSRLTPLPTVVLGALATLVLFSPVLAAQPKPPQGCMDCANYVRYSYFASSLMDWEKVTGNWRIVRRRGDNAARPVTLGVGPAEPPLLLAQSFELPHGDRNARARPGRQRAHRGALLTQQQRPLRRCRGVGRGHRKCKCLSGVCPLDALSNWRGSTYHTRCPEPGRRELLLVVQPVQQLAWRREPIPPRLAAVQPRRSLCPEPPLLRRVLPGDRRRATADDTVFLSVVARIRPQAGPRVPRSGAARLERYLRRRPANVLAGGSGPHFPARSSGSS